MEIISQMPPPTVDINNMMPKNNNNYELITKLAVSILKTCTRDHRTSPP